MSIKEASAFLDVANSREPWAKTTARSAEMICH
jgi:hypothetical protein